MNKTKKVVEPIDPLFANLHVGEILNEDYLQPLNITPYRLAKALGVPQTRIGEILKGKREITIDTALRLGRFFRTGPHFWLSMQANCQLREFGELAARIEAEVQPLADSLEKASA